MTRTHRALVYACAVSTFGAVGCNRSTEVAPASDAAGPGSVASDATAQPEPVASVAGVPCAASGGECRGVESCGRDAGALGAVKYNCGGSRRVCCFPDCAGKPETFECCNTEHTYASRPLCQDGVFVCPNGATTVPIQTCVGDVAPPPDASRD